MHFARQRSSAQVFYYFSHTTVSTKLIANRLLELKRKWEEDKAKVEKLKASRRFFQTKPNCL